MKLEKEKLRIGISQIRSARRPYILKFWNKVFEILEVKPIISDMDLLTSYELGKQFLSSCNGYCLFRCLDVGQHVDLVENHNCNCIILLSIREKEKRACSVENYVAEHLAIRYPNVKVINFFLYIDEKEKREKELEKLAKYFTDDVDKISRIKEAWPTSFVDENIYYKKCEDGKLNLLILGDMYYFLNPRMENSMYVDILCKKLNCNIITPTDIKSTGVKGRKDALKKLKELAPEINGNFKHYWRKIKMLHIIDCIVSQKDNIDGVLLVSDIWCEMFKEEVPLVVKLLEELEIPYYNLIFNMDSLSTIDTILESFVETLIERKNENGSIRD